MKFSYLFVAFFLTTWLWSQEYSASFENQMLRLDYVLAGNKVQQTAYLDEITQYPLWSGRKTSLDVSFLRGNGQVRVWDQHKNLIYVLPFSSLFQEWLTLDTSIEKKSFESSFFIPMPKNKVIVQLVHFTESQEEKVLSENTLDPKDVLIRKIDTTATAEYMMLHAAKVANPIQIAIVAEGYTKLESELFLKHAQTFKEEFFSYEAIQPYKDFFQLVAVPLASTQSGVSVPSENSWKKTALQSHFDTFYSARYLTTSRLKNMHQQLEGIPYQHLVVLANTSKYGGGGILNAYTLSSTGNQHFAPVVVHELGHSLFGLADEYFYDNDVLTAKKQDKIEPWEPNITSLVHFDQKWAKLLTAQTPIPTPARLHKKYAVGVFETIKGNGMYKPSVSCRMLDNTSTQFCAVCSQSIKNTIQYYTGTHL